MIFLPLPAGTFLLTATGSARDENGSFGGDEEVDVDCTIRNGANAVLGVGGAQSVDIGEAVDDETGPAAAINMHGVVTLAAPDTLKFQCIASGDEDGDEIDGPVFTAVRVGSVTFPRAGMIGDGLAAARTHDLSRRALCAGSDRVVRCHC